MIAPVTLMVGALILPWTGTAMAAGLADAPPGAFSCSGCHADTLGVDSAVPRLIGRDANAIVAAMQAFRSGQIPSTVMDRIAKGFTDDEIRAIAAWYAVQKE
jgi:cytochrome subunit of sulfide dehydrogenase